MSLWHDEKYLQLLSPQLDRFAQKHEHTYNFRCPLCGDSERNDIKARGYIFPKQQTLIYKCHNCSMALPFAALLRRVDRRLYDDYILERIKDESPEPQPVKTPAKAPELAPVDVHRANHVLPLNVVKVLGGPLKAVYEYARGRQIPDAAMGRLAATQRAQTWLTPMVGESKAKVVRDGEPYLVQPMTLPNGDWYGAQLRLLTKKEYLTFRWSHDPLKVFGLASWTPDALTYVVEGPLDALFVPNTIAALGSDLLSALHVMEEMGFWLKPHRVLVWDNEPRNKDVVRHIRNAIALGESVVIWPRDFPKDINDGYKLNIDVLDVMKRRTFAGLLAELEFSRWKLAS